MQNVKSFGQPPPGARESAVDGDKAPAAGARSHIDRQLKNLNSSTIMMVDDEPTTLEVLETFLEGEGYENFISVTDSTQALRLLAEERPDVLLLDVVMPNVTGLEILSAMRDDEALQLIPVIILTSSTEAETKLKGLELGATDFLNKPVDPSELALRLRNTLAAKAYRDRLAYYDGLTGLPNRRLFVERLERTLKRVKTQSIECAVLHIEIDRLKQINDTLGRSVCDALLRAIVDRLEMSVRPSDFVVPPEALREVNALSRIGGGEFSVFLPGVGPIDRAPSVARRVLSNLIEPFQVEGHDLFVTANIGIAIYPNDGENIEDLLSNAHIAMAHAKRGGQNDFYFYSESLNAELQERVSMENQLRGALDRGELLLHYQPKVDLRTGRIIGAEALMRWQHPELGLVPPVKFIPIAEDVDLIESFGEWALITACRQVRAWQDAGLSPIRVSVNVSSKQFRRGNLPETVRNALRESGVEGKYLILELTESVIMDRPQETAEMLRAIKEMGVKISIDDFGTGYSSLSTLKRFPIDELKIDRSFVMGLPDAVDSAAIVTAIIGMAHTLALTVVAEGVEKKEQLEFLKERGCEEYQGYFWSKPVPATEWPALFERDNQNS